MLIKDESLQKRQEVILQRAIQLDKARQNAEAELKDAPFVTSLITERAKAGKVLTTKDFEDKLKKLLPDMKNETFTALDGTQKRYAHLPPYIRESKFVYDYPVLPERSVREIIKKRKITDGVISSDPQAKALIRRSDLPRHKVIGPSFNKNGEVASLGRVEWESDLPAGMEEISIPGREVIRGWRTVLVMLRHCGYLTPQQIEKEFGADNTAAWAKHMGKQEIRLPW